MLCGVGLRHLLHFIFRSRMQQCPYLGMGLGEQLHDSFLPHNSLGALIMEGWAGLTMGGIGRCFRTKRPFVSQMAYYLKAYCSQTYIYTLLLDKYSILSIIYHFSMKISDQDLVFTESQEAEHHR